MTQFPTYHDPFNVNPFNVNIPLPPGPGYGRGRIAAILEACTGRSLLRPDAPRAVQQDHARKVADARAELRLDAAPVKPSGEPPPSPLPDGLRTPPLEAARKLRKPRRPSISKMIAQAEKAGKPVTSITTPDGMTLRFGEPEPGALENPWFADLDKAKQQ